MEKGKRIKALVLPEEVMQHVQSFLSGKEAARTTVLSKSWRAAWLTLPAVDLDDRNFFHNRSPEWEDAFEEFANDTMQRYEGLKLKIERFSLRSRLSDHRHLIVNAVKLGATHLQLDLPFSFTLPRKVLGSKTLLRLAVSRCEIDGDYAISCSRLKSLSLDAVRISTSDRFKDIMISCRDSLEELSLSHCNLALSLGNLYELHKLKRLFLDSVYVDTMFFTKFAARFPCLKDLALHDCRGFTKLHIASLQTISFKHELRNTKSCLAEFDVPNIRKFVYLGGDYLPSINGASKECKFKISISCHNLSDPCWYQDLKEKLTKFRQSKISLYINILDNGSHLMPEDEVCTETILVEKLKIIEHSSSCECHVLVLRLLGICRPKFITHYFWHTCRREDVLYNKLMHKPITPNSGIPDQKMFGKFGLKRVNLDVYEKFDDDKRWRRLVLEKPLGDAKTHNNSQRVRFELIWGINCVMKMIIISLFLS